METVFNRQPMENTSCLRRTSKDKKPRSVSNLVGQVTTCFYFQFSAVNEKDMRQWIVYINTGKMPEDSAKSDSPRDKVEEDIEIEEGDLYEDEEPPMSKWTVK